MGVKELAEQIAVKVQPIKIKRKNSRPVIVKKNIHTQKFRVNISNFDPRKARINKLEAPVLRERGFKPTDDTMNEWKGRYRSHPVQIILPLEYPAVPFRWYWIEVPSGFEHVVGSQLCIEALLDNNAWTPEMTVETVFEGLDSHPYFER